MARCFLFTAMTSARSRERAALTVHDLMLRTQVQNMYGVMSCPLCTAFFGEGSLLRLFGLLSAVVMCSCDAKYKTFHSNGISFSVRSRTEALTLEKLEQENVTRIISD